jgi:hypothetical protein
MSQTLSSAGVDENTSSETPPWNLELFFRYTVTGTVIVLWLCLALPAGLFLDAVKSATLSALLAAFLVLLVILLGWIAYHLLYPFWRWVLSSPLSTLHAYPRPLVYEALRDLIGTTNLSIGPRELWSYFLWQCCDGPIRRRIKVLADAGHSLYIAAFAFVAFPTAYVIVRIFFSYQTSLLDLVMSAFASGMGVSLVLTIAYSFSLLIGVGLVKEGHGRIEYAQRIQWILLRENEARMKALILAMQNAPKGAAAE